MEVAFWCTTQFIIKLAEPFLSHLSRGTGSWLICQLHPKSSITCSFILIVLFILLVGWDFVVVLGTTWFILFRNTFTKHQWSSNWHCYLMSILSPCVVGELYDSNDLSLLVNFPLFLCISLFLQCQHWLKWVVLCFYLCVFFYFEYLVVLCRVLLKP